MFYIATYNTAIPHLIHNYIFIIIYHTLIIIILVFIHNIIFITLYIKYNYLI